MTADTAAIAARPPVVVTAPQAGRSVTLPVLYAGMIAAQALDIISTRQALSRAGTYEANPIFSVASGSTAGSIALKAGATAGIIYLSERLRKTNRGAAIAMMVVLNSTYAMVAGHNFAIAARTPAR